MMLLSAPFILVRSWRYQGDDIWMGVQADHMSIYVMIAGSYTPFIWIYYWVPEGEYLLILLWSLVVLGILFKFAFTGRYTFVSTMIYVLMGLSILWVADTFFGLLPYEVYLFLIAGGVFYLVGVLFYLMKFWRYHHPVWHLFVMGGAGSHWWALWLALGG